MNGKSKRRPSKRRIIAFICAGLVAVLIISLLISNLFLPVRYLYAYINFGTDKPEPSVSRVRFLDLDSGDCTFAEFPDGKTLLVDGGADMYTCRLKIFKTLKKSGVSHIDYIISTDCDGGRSGGLAEIAKYFEVGVLYAPQYTSETSTGKFENFMAVVSDKKIPVKNGSYGTQFGGENYSVVMLNSRTYADPSDWTLPTIVYMKIYDAEFLLLGACGERELQNFYSNYMLGDNAVDLGGIDIVKAADGGRSTCSRLADLLRPKTAIICGNGVTAQTWADFQKHTDEIYRTDYDGTVTILASAEGYKAQKEKR